MDDNVESIGDALKAKASEAFQLLGDRRAELEDFQKQYVKANDAVYALHNEVSTVRVAAEDKQGLIRRLRKNLPAEESLA